MRLPGARKYRTKTPSSMGASSTDEGWQCEVEFEEIESIDAHGHMPTL